MRAWDSHTLRSDGPPLTGGAPAVKSLGFILSYLSTAQARRNLRILGWMVGLFVVVVAVYSALP